MSLNENQLKKKKINKWKPDGSIHLEESYWDNKIEPMSILGIDSPGPLLYADIDSKFKKLSKYKSYGSVKIAEGNPKSDVDWKIYRASFIPSSADYNPNDSLKGPSGGQFSTAYAKTPLEWIEYRAKQLPGPQDYYPRESLKENSFRFSEAKPKSDVEWKIYRAASIPGPADYNLQNSGYASGASAKLLGRFERGNYQTTLPDAIQYSHTTINSKGPTQCREKGSLGFQPDSMKKTAPSFHFGAKTRQDRYDYGLMCDDEKDWRLLQRKMLAKKKRKKMKKRLEQMGDNKRMFGFDPLDLNFSQSVLNHKLNRLENETKAWHNNGHSHKRQQKSSESSRNDKRSRKKLRRKQFKKQRSSMENLSKPKYCKSLPSLSYHAAMMRVIEQNRQRQELHY